MKIANLYRLCVLLGLLAYAPLSAFYWQPLDLSIEGRIAYYKPSSKRVQEIYSNGWADYQVEVSKDFFCNWRVWAGVSGFSKKGHSIGFNDPTRIQMIPVSLGVKYMYSLTPCTKIYLGGAGCYSFLKIRDHSDYVHQHIRKEEFGGLIQAGAYYYFSRCLYADVFVDYLFQHFHFSHSHDSYYYVKRNSLDMSGFKVGAGIGCTF